MHHTFERRASRKASLSPRVATLLAAVAALGVGCSDSSSGPPLSPLRSQTAASTEKSSTFSDWSEPVNLGYVVNAKGFRSITPGIAPGGLSLYFASRRTNVPRDFNLYVTQRVSREAPWGPPRTLGPNLFTPGAGFANRSPSLTPDGEHLFFNTFRPNGCGNFDLWVSSREDTSDDFGWGVPVSLGCVINSPSLDEASSYFKDQETGVASLYFSSDRGGPVGRFQIYVSTQQDDGTWGPAVPVPEFNSPYSSDGCPNIRADGLEFYFCSDRPPRVGTSGFEVDLWVSTRATTRDPWSPPCLWWGTRLSRPSPPMGRSFT